LRAAVAEQTMQRAEDLRLHRLLAEHKASHRDGDDD
jgi:hypothetical protein